MAAVESIVGANDLWGKIELQLASTDAAKTVELRALSSTTPLEPGIRAVWKPEVQDPLHLGGGLGHPEKSKVQDPPLEGVLAELESPSSKTPPLDPPGALQTYFCSSKQYPSSIKA